MLGLMIMGLAAFDSEFQVQVESLRLRLGCSFLKVKYLIQSLISSTSREVPYYGTFEINLNLSRCRQRRSFKKPPSESETWVASRA